jgi:hypothetical protein
MTLLRRNVAADFVRDVGARTNGNRVWAAVLNPDGTTYSINLTTGGGTTAVFPKVFWPGPICGAKTDATFGDSVVVYSVEGVSSIGDALQFLNSLT